MGLVTALIPLYRSLFPLKLLKPCDVSFDQLLTNPNCLANFVVKFVSNTLDLSSLWYQIAYLAHDTPNLKEGLGNFYTELGRYF